MCLDRFVRRLRYARPILRCTQVLLLAWRSACREYIYRSSDRGDYRPHRLGVCGVPPPVVASFWRRLVRRGPERFVLGNGDPGNFEKDTPKDTTLRAYFRQLEAHYTTEIRILFSSFSGCELRAVLHAAGDPPTPIGNSDMFFKSNYHRSLERVCEALHFNTKAASQL